MPASTVVPVLGYEDVGAAIQWLCRTFGFRCCGRVSLALARGLMTEDNA